MRESDKEGSIQIESRHLWLDLTNPNTETTMMTQFGEKVYDTL